MDEEKNNLDLLIIKWFKNLIFNTNDNTILLLNISHGFKQNLQKKLKENFAITNYHIIAIERLHQYNSFTNVICMIENRDKKNIAIFNEISRGKRFLYIPSNHSFYQNIDSFFNPNALQSSQDIKINNNERYKYYLEKIKPYDLLEYSKNDLISFIKYRIKNLGILLDIHFTLDLLVNNTTYKNQPSSTYHALFENDINLLDSRRILTSRLATILYRLATFEINANTTKIGRYFHDTSGNRSKVFSPKGDDVMLPDLNNKSFKAYDLNVNESELAIRKEIAAKLKSLNILDLDIELISEVTGLSIENVKKSTF